MRPLMFIEESFNGLPQAINNKEYMIAAEDNEDMLIWLDIIHRCMEADTSAPRYFVA